MLADLTHVRVEGVDLCLRDRGSGPTVVLLHGTSANLGVWDPVVELLGAGVRTIAVDQRGHGRSGKPSTGYGAVEYCADLGGLVTDLACGPVVVVGHSLGARNAVVFGATHPELVRGVVAVDYTPHVEPRVLDDLEVRVRGGARTFASVSDIAAYLSDRYRLMPRDAIERRVAYGYVDGGSGYQPLADPDAMVATVEGLRQDFDREFEGIECPLSLVRGALSAIVSDEAFAAARRLRPDVRALELTGVDHYVPEERPETVAEEITRLLAAVA